MAGYGMIEMDMRSIGFEMAAMMALRNQGYWTQKSNGKYAEARAQRGKAKRIKRMKK